MAQLTKCVEPFGEVNAFKQKDGSIDIVATILMVPDIEGASTGLALDASASMKKMYGVSGMVSPLFAQAAGVPNVVEPVARTMAAYLANFAAQGQVNMIYWACGPDGSKVEEIGTFPQDHVRSLAITGPKKEAWGKGTRLLPPLRYFAETAFSNAPWAIAVFVTDGILDDLEEVKQYTVQLAKQIAERKRNFIKLVLIGVGEAVDEGQMEQLDDLPDEIEMKDAEGNDIDLWDHKLASEMQKIEEIFAEVVSEDVIVAGSGRILDSSGREVRAFNDGLPALLKFKLPKGSDAFTLEFPGGKITQSIAGAV